MRYKIRHTTEYIYQDTVSTGHNRLCLVPLNLRSRLVGIIALGRPQGESYDEEAMEVLGLLSHYVAVALHHHLLTQTLEQRVQELRHQLQRLVKAPGAPIKSAPFHTATTLQSLPTGTEVLIVISTTYWVGVETHNGQHGWILRDDLELLP